MIKYTVETVVDGSKRSDDIWANDDFHALNISRMILKNRMKGLKPDEYGLAYGIKLPMERKDDNA